VFTFNGRGKDTTAIDVATGKVAGTIPLGGKPESPSPTARDACTSIMRTRAEIVEFDPQALKETHRWKLTGCESPSGLAMDRKNRRLFAGCDNKKMAVMNADTAPSSPPCPSATVSTPMLSIRERCSLSARMAKEILR